MVLGGFEHIHTSCTLSALSLHQLHLRLSGIRSQRLGFPVWNHITMSCSSYPSVLLLFLSGPSPLLFLPFLLCFSFSAPHFCLPTFLTLPLFCLLFHYFPFLASSSPFIPFTIHNAIWIVFWTRLQSLLKNSILRTVPLLLQITLELRNFS